MTFGEIAVRAMEVPDGDYEVIYRIEFDLWNHLANDSMVLEFSFVVGPARAMVTGTGSQRFTKLTDRGIVLGLLVVWSLAD